MMMRRRMGAPLLRTAVVAGGAYAVGSHAAKSSAQEQQQNAQMAVPASVNIANADTVNWKQTGAPEKLVRLQQRAATAHHSMGSACSFTCTPYWAGHWPTWNTHMTSIESTVTIFCNSVIKYSSVWN